MKTTMTAKQWNVVCRLILVASAVCYWVTGRQLLPVAAARVIINDDVHFLYQTSTDPNARAVIDVTNATIGFFQTSTQHRIVEFYSPYCGHCISFAKKYMNVAAQTRAKYGVMDTTVEFYGVSCVAWPDLCAAFAIDTYPSVYAYAAVVAPAAGTGRSAAPHHATVTTTTTTEPNTTRVPIGTLLFSVGKVEKALKLRLGRGATSSSSVRHLLQTNQQDKDADEMETVEEVPRENHPADDETTGAAGGMEQKQTGDAVGDDRDNGRGDNEDTDTAEEQDDSKRGTVHDARQQTDILPLASNKQLDDDEASSPDIEFENFKAISASAVGRTRTRAGAAQAKHKPRYMDGFQAEQAVLRLSKQQRHSLFQRRNRDQSTVQRESSSLLTDGATPIMLSNRRNTDEYKARQAQTTQILSRMQSRRRYKKTRGALPLTPKTRVYQKRVARPRLAESVPVVRHIVRMNHEEQLILDASLSFLEGLRVGIYKTKEPLDDTKKKALHDWLHLMRVSLPAEWALHDTIDDLMAHFEEITQGSKGLRSILDKHPMPRKQWSASCQGTNGFTCGFWKLLHIMTVGVAEHRGGQDLIESGMFKSTLSVVSPKEAADTLREYMVHFFMCTECSDNFVAMYDDCDKHRRCDRLSGDAREATDADWKELAKWLWEVHNSVSVRLLNEHEDEKRKRKQRAIVLKAGAGPGVANRMDQVQALWPAIDDCAMCVNEDGSWDENRIFLHLEATYWPGFDLKDTPRRLISFGDDSDEALRLNLILLLVALVILCLLRSRVVRASVAQTVLLRAKATLRTRSTAGKLRTV